MSEENLKLVVIDALTYKLINSNLGIKQIFTDATNLGGLGNSTVNHPRIDLYDKECGTPHTVNLYDNYGAGDTFNQAVFEVIIRPDTVDVTWEASPLYLHWCFAPHQFEQGSVQYGTETLTLDTQSDRRSAIPLQIQMVALVGVCRSRF